MSPSEFDLRAALREGEGTDAGGLDAGRLIADANRIRRERRRRINTGIGVAAVVGVIGTFGVLIGGLTSGSESGGGSAAAASKAAPGGYAGARSNSLAPVAGGNASAEASTVPSPRHNGGNKAAPSCPSVPVPLPPASRGLHPLGSLFPAGVSSIAACAYPANGGTTFGALVTGTAARSLANSLDSAPSRPDARHGRCFTPFDGHGTVQLRVYDSSGTMIAPLTVAPDCHQAKVTNGTVTKYPNRLAPPLPGLLRAVR
jgi:hypothetical protein